MISPWSPVRAWRAADRRWRPAVVQSEVTARSSPWWLVARLPQPLLAPPDLNPAHWSKLSQHQGKILLWEQAGDISWPVPLVMDQPRSYEGKGSKSSICSHHLREMSLILCVWVPRHGLCKQRLLSYIQKILSPQRKGLKFATCKSQ